ncbi:MAG: UbiA family prenyltransferase [Planctomycetota bacterium]
MTEPDASRRTALLRLLRPALAPTAAADVLAAAAFAGGADAARLAWGTAAAVCLYAGGMVQNDLCDRERDRTPQPDRPLVVDPGLVGPARLLAAALFGVGLACGGLAGAFWPALAVALLASAYNLGLKRFFPFDALTLGAARAANLTLGLTIAGASPETATLLYPAGYGLFIAGVTAASRAEDLEPVETRKLALLLAFLPQLIAFIGLSLVAVTGLRVLVFALPCLLQAFALVVAMRAGTRLAAKRYVFHSVLLIFVVHGCTLWARGASEGLIGVCACAAATFFVLGWRAGARRAT